MAIPQPSKHVPMNQPSTPKHLLINSPIIIKKIPKNMVFKAEKYPIKKDNNPQVIKGRDVITPTKV